VALCTSCVNRCFGGNYRLHLEGRKILERPTSVSRWLYRTATTCSRCFLARRFFYPEMEAILSSENWFTQDLHSTTFQKTTFFIVTAVKTSILIYYLLFQRHEKQQLLYIYLVTRLIFIFALFTSELVALPYPRFIQS
jgi:hypothetical protein